MLKKENIYAKSDEKFVKTLVLYADSSDKLFYDKAAKADAVQKDDLLDLFMKGVTVFKTDVYYKPVAFKESGIVGYDGTSAVTFTAA